MLRSPLCEVAPCSEHGGFLYPLWVSWQDFGAQNGKSSPGRMVNPALVNHIQLLELKAGWREQRQPSAAVGLCRIVSLSQRCPAGQIPFVSGAACYGIN